MNIKSPARPFRYPTGLCNSPVKDLYFAPYANTPQTLAELKLALPLHPTYPRNLQPATRRSCSPQPGNRSRIVGVAEPRNRSLPSNLDVCRSQLVMPKGTPRPRGRSSAQLRVARLIGLLSSLRCVWAEHAVGVPSDIRVRGGSFPHEVSWSLACDSLSAPITGGAPYSATHAVPPGSCALTMSDSFGDGWSGSEWSAPGWSKQSYSLPNGLHYNVSFGVGWQPPLAPPRPQAPPSSPLPPLPP